VLRANIWAARERLAGRLGRLADCLGQLVDRLGRLADHRLCRLRRRADERLVIRGTCQCAQLHAAAAWIKAHDH
jgi:hypothetical protein